MNSSFSKQEADLEAERTRQEFNAAASGYVAPPTSSGNGTPPGKPPEQVLKPEGSSELQAQAAAGMSSQPDPKPSNSLENETQNALGLDQGQDLGLGL